ncbi:hypothetical protein Sjap_001296 [Stephania japonica]|uniref:Uncharacterized protein n=1 Tax=Stephania japonica TaxID=461633 RepID=A0AAP0KJP4_9MAGN
MAKSGECLSHPLDVEGAVNSVYATSPTHWLFLDDFTNDEVPNMYQVVYLNKVSDLPLLGQQSVVVLYEQVARPPQQGSQQESQPTKALRRKWSHMEDLALLNAMVEMVHTGVYRGDNGFKPGYLTHLEEALKTSCPKIEDQGKTTHRVSYQDFEKGLVHRE